jgi:hypothetical protein
MLVRGLLVAAAFSRLLCFPLAAVRNNADRLGQSEPSQPAGTGSMIHKMERQV